MNKKQMKLPNGEIVTLYYIGKLAEELGRTSQTVRKWEVSGILPKPIFKDKQGKRMYSEEQIDTIVQCAMECKLRQGYCVANTSFPKRVHEALATLNSKYISK